MTNSIFQFISPDDGSQIAAIDLTPLVAHKEELGLDFSGIFPQEPLTDRWDNPGLLSIISGAKLRLTQFAGARTFHEETKDEMEMTDEEKYAAQVFGSSRLSVHDRTQVTFKVPVLEATPAWVTEAGKALDDLKTFIEAGEAHPGCLLRNVGLEASEPIIVPMAEIPVAEVEVPAPVEVVEGEPAP